MPSRVMTREVADWGYVDPRSGTHSTQHPYAVLYTVRYSTQYSVVVYVV